MSRHRDFRNLDLDDLSGDEFSDPCGSLPNSYDSMGEFYAPPSLSLSAALDDLGPDASQPTDNYDNRPEDYQLLDPGLDEMEPILGDSFSFDQMIAALRATNYQVNAAIDWLMTGDEGDAPFALDEDLDDLDDLARGEGLGPPTTDGIRRTAHAAASLFPPKARPSTPTPSPPPPSQSPTPAPTPAPESPAPAPAPGEGQQWARDAGRGWEEVGLAGGGERVQPSALAGVLCSESTLLWGRGKGGARATGAGRASMYTRVFPHLHPLPGVPSHRWLLPPPAAPALPPGLQPFAFDQPSPDDLILQRQAHSSLHHKEAGARPGGEGKDSQGQKKKTPAEPFTPIVVGDKKKKQPPKGGKGGSKSNPPNSNNKNKNTTPQPSSQGGAAPPTKGKGEREGATSGHDQDDQAAEALVRGLGGARENALIIPKPKKAIHQMSGAARTHIQEALRTTQDKEHINLVVVGHVDAGKSTTMGRLLLELGYIDQRTMHKYKKLAHEEGKASFVYAWILDEQGEERSRGVTIDVGLNYFETPHKRVTLLDAPGHKDFVPNMITGAAQADCALLMLDATVGEFETGLDDDGQTKEHTLLLRSLGVDNLVVVVNKLDMVDYSQERYDFIVQEMRKFLKQAGYKPRKIRFIPCSGWNGENLVKRSHELLCSWYSGDTLAEAIDHFDKVERATDGPFRMCISDVFKNIPLGLACSGKIESGVVGVGDNLLIIPGYEICTVKALEVHDKNTQYASAGDNVSLGVQGIDPTNIGIGHFCCDPQKPIPFTNRFMAKIITFKLRYPLIQGATVTLQYQNVTVEAVLIRLQQVLDKTTGAVAGKRPRSIPDSTAALVAIRTEQPICVETFSSNKGLGRFTLRDAGQTVATGVITKLLLRKL